MRQAMILLLVWAGLATAHAQEFGTHWISHPQPDSTSHVWFRQSYLGWQRPRRATVTVASTGFFKLYVNEFVVGTAAYYPLRDDGDGTPKAVTFDVTRYLRNDTNTVAVLYSPATPQTDGRQVAVTYYGQMADGSRFSHHSDGNWLCRRANSRRNAYGSEFIDGRQHNTTWRAATFDPALWLTARAQQGTPGEPTLPLHQFYQATKTTHCRSYRYFDTKADTVRYEFGEGWIGGLCVTLREARRGEYINIGGMEYICSGEMDEQAYPRFPRQHCRGVLVWGDRRFRRAQITDIMTLETSTVTYDDFDD